MQDISTHTIPNRVVLVTLRDTSPVAAQLDKVCKLANECQATFHFSRDYSSDALDIALVDSLDDLLLFDATPAGGRVNMAYLRGACRLARLGTREYIAILATLASLNAMALRQNEEMIAEDLQPAPHPPCLLSPAQTELELLGNMDELLFCAKCADFLSALGLEGEVLATQQLLRTIYERRRDRSHFRWGLRGMDRPPSHPL